MTTLAAKSFADRLRELEACEDSVEWVGDRDLSTAWSECETPEWMFWLVGIMADKPGWTTRKQIVLVAADIAESVIHLVRPKDKDVCIAAIQAARDCAEGKIDQAAARAAAYAADAAARAAAYAARDAAYAARAAAYAADAAARAAADAAADAAARAAAYAEKRKEICQWIRSKLQIGAM